RRCERTARGNLVPIGRVSVHTRSPRRYAPRDDDSVVASAQRVAISGSGQSGERYEVATALRASR
ncbi:MAG: hypothetical protein WD001_00950, partial [Woeseia sp.]